MRHARVHHDTCVHCPPGRRQAERKKTNSGATGRYRSFVTAGYAEGYMRREFAWFTNLARCQSCKPGDRGIGESIGAS
jgi:hypothetical protein